MNSGIIAVYGPTGAGKSTVIDTMQVTMRQEWAANSVVLEFGLLLRQYLTNMFPGTKGYKKEAAPVGFSSRTIRELMIDLHEQFIKKTLGEVFLATQIVEKIKVMRDLGVPWFLVGGVGNNQEADELRKCGLPIFWVKVSQEGATYSDNRKELQLLAPGDKVYEIQNDKNLEYLLKGARSILASIMQQ